MSTQLTGTIGVFLLLALMFLGVPIWLCMMLVGAAGCLLILGAGATLTLAQSTCISTAADYTFAVLPAFLLMGEFAGTSGMMHEAYGVINTWMGKIRGGLAMASVIGAAAFSCVSGSSMACAAIMTRIALPSLLKYKYDPRLATGALAAGGTLGNLIPPGLLLVVYAMLTEVSLGKLFIACYIPGILLTVMYIVQIYIQCRINPSLGPAAGSSTWKEKLHSIKGIAPVSVVFLIVLGGIQFGVFTPNEAASVGTVFIFIYALARKTINRQNLAHSFKDTLVVTGMCLAIIISTRIFSVFMAASGVSQALAELLVGLNLSTFGVVILIMLVYFILGIPLDPMATILLTLPVFMTVLNTFHIDLIWFGVLIITQVEMANLTPPVGMNLFVVSGMVKPLGISMGTVFRGSLPFCITILVFLVLLIAFPQISLVAVNFMK